MNVTAYALIDQPEQVTSLLTPSGIPALTIGATSRSAVVIQLDRSLAPTQQVDFLRALAEEASELATRVAALHAEPVGVRG